MNINITSIYNYLKSFKNKTEAQNIAEHDLDYIYMVGFIYNREDGKKALTNLGHIALLGSLDNFVLFFQLTYLKNQK